MKSVILGLVLGLIPAILIAQNQHTDSTKFINDHYRERIKVFSGEQVKKTNVLFLGNSITEFGDWKVLLNDPNVLNRGIAGDNTYGVLARLQDVIARKPSKVFIEIGVNDIGSGFTKDIILKNMLSIVARIHTGSPESAIYILSILPVNDDVKTNFPQFENKNKQFDEVNQQLIGNAAKNNYIFINLSSLLKNSDGKLSKQYAKPDGLHLNDLGYQVWIRLLKEKRYL